MVKCEMDQRQRQRFFGFKYWKWVFLVSDTSYSEMGECLTLIPRDAIASKKDFQS